MGTCNIDFTLDGKLDKNEVIAKFKQQQLDDKDENGHQQGYSGDFQTVHGVEFHDEVFDDREKAEAYCLDKAEKWSYVVAVKYWHKDKLRWLVAGWGGGLLINN